MFAVHDSAHKKSCTHVVAVHWSKTISKNAPLPAVHKIQIRINSQCVLSVIATLNSLFPKAIPCKLIQYWVPISKLHASFWERTLHVFLFWLWQGRFSFSIQMKVLKQLKLNFFYIFVHIYIYIYIYIYILMNRRTFTNETEILNLVEFITII